MITCRYKMYLLTVLLTVYNLDFFGGRSNTFCCQFYCQRRYLRCKEASEARTGANRGAVTPEILLSPPFGTPTFNLFFKPNLNHRQCLFDSADGASFRASRARLALFAVQNRSSLFRLIKPINCQRSLRHRSR